jgi:hypothetical protein
MTLAQRHRPEAKQLVAGYCGLTWIVWQRAGGRGVRLREWCDQSRKVGRCYGVVTYNDAFDLWEVEGRLRCGRNWTSDHPTKAEGQDALMAWVDACSFDPLPAMIMDVPLEVASNFDPYSDQGFSSRANTADIDDVDALANRLNRCMEAYFELLGPTGCTPRRAARHFSKFVHLVILLDQSVRMRTATIEGWTSPHPVHVRGRLLVGVIGAARAYIGHKVPLLAAELGAPPFVLGPDMFREVAAALDQNAGFGMIDHVLVTAKLASL